MFEAVQNIYMDDQIFTDCLHFPLSDFWQVELPCTWLQISPSGRAGNQTT